MTSTKKYKHPQHECVYWDCKIYPHRKLKQGKSMVDACKYYPGYGYCDSPKYGKKIESKSNAQS